MVYDQEKFVNDLNEVLKEIRTVLIEKNKKYGNSVFQPVGILTKMSVRERIFVRIEDKLARLAQGDGDNEDTLLDLNGYLILERIDAKRNATAKQD